MNWTWIRRGLLLAGVIYAWALIPLGFRPQVPNNPIRKSTQMITVDIDTPDETGVPWHAAGQVENACKPPVLLRPFEQSATSVRVLLRYKTKIVHDVIVPCPES